MHFITESRPLKNVARENANKPEKRKRACVTSRRPVILAVHSMICSLGGSLSDGSPVVVFFDCGHPRFWNFYSTIPVDVVRVKSYKNCLFDPARVVIAPAGFLAPEGQKPEEAP